MSKQANKTVIGIFVVVAIALVVAAVLILGSGKFFKKTFKAVCYFEGSVGGLNIGSPVVFRGVRIGSVTDIILRVETTNWSFSIPVYIEIDPYEFQVIGARSKHLGENLKKFVDRGLSASLETQSIVTGQMQVSVDFRPEKHAKFTEFKFDQETPEIPTVPTPMQELAQKIQKIPIEQIFENLNSTLAAIDKLVSSPAIPEAFRSVNLALEDVRKFVQNTDNRIGPLTSNLNETVQDARKLLQNADAKVAGLASSLEETVKEVRGIVKNVDNQLGPLGKSVEGTIKSVDETLALAQKTVKGIDTTVGESSTLAYQLDSTLEEIKALSQSIRRLADYLERHPESVIWGK